MSVSLLACAAAPEGAAPPEVIEAAPATALPVLSIPATCAPGDTLSCFTTGAGIVSVPHCVCVPGFYSNYAPTGASTPSSYMLDELGKVTTTIHNQGQNGGYWGFGDVAVVESEYVSELGYPAATFALSDQYNIFDAIKGYWGESDSHGNPATAPSIGSFEMIGHYGLPPLSSYPDNLQGPWNVLPKVIGPIYSAENPQAFPSALSTFAATGVVNSSWLSAIGTFIAQNPFANDMTRFNSAALAPLSVHEQAAYAPTSAAWVDFATKYPTGGANNCLDPSAAGDTTINCENAYPFEEVLNQNHTIRVEMDSDPDNWSQDPNTKVFYYNPNGGNDGHVVAVVGYDRTRQVFRFKNSWGQSWGNNGFGEMTYYLLMKIIETQATVNGVHQGSFVTGVRNPSAGTLGAGAWMGFWNATIGTQKGVATLHYTYPYEIGVNNGTVPVVDVFQSASGQIQQLSTVSGSTTAWNIAFSGTPTSPEYAVAAPFTLARTAGATTAIYTNPSTGETETWYKCNPGTGYAVAPTQYAGAANDPYVLPPCGETNWEAPPSLTCNGSDLPVAGGSVQYAPSATPQQFAWETGNYCLGISSTIPQCPAGQQLNLDTGLSYYGYETSPGYASEDICTLDGQATASGNSTLPLSCYASPIPVLGVSQYVGYVTNANQIPVSSNETVFQVGQDHCLSSIYEGTFACTGATVMQTNGDCFLRQLVLRGIVAAL